MKKTILLEKIDIFSVLSSLISSQLDADRLDYLVRDAYNCGVSFGKIDIQRIISALSLTVYDNQYYVCVPEKYIGDIEDYLLARYHMQSVVYYRYEGTDGANYPERFFQEHKSFMKRISCLIVLLPLTRFFPAIISK